MILFSSLQSSTLQLVHANSLSLNIKFCDRHRIVKRKTSRQRTCRVQASGEHSHPTLTSHFFTGDAWRRGEIEVYAESQAEAKSSYTHGLHDQSVPWFQFTSLSFIFPRQSAYSVAPTRPQVHLPKG